MKEQLCLTASLCKSLLCVKSFSVQKLSLCQSVSVKELLCLTASLCNSLLCVKSFSVQKLSLCKSVSV